jgi:hypothetical protein
MIQKKPESEKFKTQNTILKQGDELVTRKAFQ